MADNVCDDLAQDVHPKAKMEYVMGTNTYGDESPASSCAYRNSEGYVFRTPPHGDGNVRTNTSTPHSHSRFLSFGEQVGSLSGGCVDADDSDDVQVLKREVLELREQVTELNKYKSVTTAQLDYLMKKDASRDRREEEIAAENLAADVVAMHGVLVISSRVGAAMSISSNSNNNTLNSNSTATASDNEREGPLTNIPVLQRQGSSRLVKPLKSAWAMLAGSVTLLTMSNNNNNKSKCLDNLSMRRNNHIRRILSELFGSTSSLLSGLYAKKKERNSRSHVLIDIEKIFDYPDNTIANINDAIDQVDRVWPQRAASYASSSSSSLSSSSSSSSSSSPSSLLLSSSSSSFSSPATPTTPAAPPPPPSASSSIYVFAPIVSLMLHQIMSTLLGLEEFMVDSPTLGFGFEADNENHSSPSSSSSPFSSSSSSSSVARALFGLGLSSDSSSESGSGSSNDSDSKASESGSGSSNDSDSKASESASGSSNDGDSKASESASESVSESASESASAPAASALESQEVGSVGSGSGEESRSTE